MMLFEATPFSLELRLLVEADNDKPTVIALREIAEGLVNAEILTEKPSVEIEELEGNSLDETQIVAQQEEPQKTES